VYFGSYPEEMRDIFGVAWPEFPAEDFALIRQPIDFLGINYYTRGVVRDDPTALPVRIAYVKQPEHAYTETGWEFHPASLTRTLLWVTERYGRMPIYITENGAAFYDAPHAIDGRVDDPLRVWYFREHIRAARDAIAGGADLRGYFAWSLLDNYEWSLGYSKRFGIVHVNYETQERTPKASARYYSTVIASNGEVLGAA
jgi:beta-glucosidase